MKYAQASNGVGGYADTMRDLIANICGGALFLAIPARLRLRNP